MNLEWGVYRPKVLGELIPKFAEVTGHYIYVGCSASMRSGHESFRLSVPYAIHRYTAWRVGGDMI